MEMGSSLGKNKRSSPLIIKENIKVSQISIQDILNVSGNKRAFFFGVPCDNLHGYQDANMNIIKMQVFLADRGFQIYFANSENSIESEFAIFCSSLISGDIIFIYYCGAGGIMKNTIERYTLEDSREVSTFDLILKENIHKIPSSCVVMILIDDGCVDTSFDLPHKLEYHDDTFRTIHYIDDQLSINDQHLYIKFESAYDRKIYGNFFTRTFIQRVQNISREVTWKDFLTQCHTHASKYPKFLKMITISTNLGNLADYEMKKIL